MDETTRFDTWIAAEEAAELLVPLLGRLYRDGVVIRLHGTRLVHRSPVEIVRAHRKGHRAFGYDVDVADTLEAVQAVDALGLASCEIDIGKLLVERAASDTSTPVGAWMGSRLDAAPRADGESKKGHDVVLYGFGRIGRLMARLLVENAAGGDRYRLRAVVVRKRADDDLVRRANLLRRDSVHGRFGGTITAAPDEGAIYANGTKIQFIQANAPEEIDYTAYGIHDATIIDNTGVWRDRDGLSRHLAAKGVSRVLLTAPGKGDVPNIVMGVNDDVLTGDERIVSAASCTTNAIVPTLKAMHDRYGIVRGHIETVHAYTNDQNLIDNYHKKARRGRSAALNMVITETGAAKAAAKALPEMAGRLTASAIRVPTPNVSLAIMNLELAEDTSRDAVNGYLQEIAYASPLQEQVGWTVESDTVSSDMVGDVHAGVVDGEATLVDGNKAVLYVWYDNEYGYSCQVLRLLSHVLELERPVVA